MSDVLNLKMKIDSWDENVDRELPDGSKVSLAAVSLGEGARQGGFNATMFYRADGTAVITCVLDLDVEIDGRRGAFAAACTGTYESGTARRPTPARQSTRRQPRTAQ